MKQYKDITKNAVRHVIEPFLSQYGFCRSKEKDFFRVRGDFLDNIYFGFGRWGADVIYIYYSVHLLTDPIDNIDTYIVGDRFSATWRRSDHEACCQSAQALLPKLEAYALQWFNEVDCVDKYEGAVYEYGYLSIFAAIAQNDWQRAQLYIEDKLTSKSGLPFNYGYPDEDVLKTKNQHVEQLRLALEAIKTNTVEQWRVQVIANKCSQLGIKIDHE